MTSTRPYRMSTRAASAEATRSRIAEVALRLFIERWYDDVTLRVIAEEAGVSLQTVVNHFASKEGVFSAALQHYRSGVEELRATAEPDDIASAVAVLRADYEPVIDAHARLGALEERVPAVAALIAEGHEVHRAWVARTFPGALAGLRGATRERRLAGLMAATDIATWRLLRRHHDFSPQQTAATVRDLVSALYPKEPPR
jgi:AcrR family transcriptional regulator